MTENQQAANRQKLAVHRRTAAEAAPTKTFTDEQFAALLATVESNRAAVAPTPPKAAPAPHPLAESLHQVEGSDRRRIEGEMWNEWAAATGADQTSPFWRNR